MFCTTCGFELPEETVFCTSCGAKQEQEVVEPENLQSDETNGQKKQKKWGKLIGLSVAGVAAVVFVAGAIVFNQPKIKLMRSAGKTYRDSVEIESGVGKYLGLKDLETLILTGNTHQDMSFSAKQYGQSLGIRTVINMDQKSGETGVLCYPIYNNLELTELLLYQNQERTVMAAPDLYDGAFYYNNEDAMKNYRESTLNSYVEYWTGNPNSGDFMSEKDWDMYYNQVNQFTEQFTDTWKQMGKNTTVKKTGSKNFTIGGKLKKCTGYEVIVPKRDIKNVLRDVTEFMETSNVIKKIVTSMEQMSEDEMEYVLDELDETMMDLEDSLEDDLVMVLYTGPKGRLVSMECEYEFIFGQYVFPVSLSVSLLGAGNPLDVVEVECDYKEIFMRAGGNQELDRYTISLLREQTYDQSSKQLEDSGEITVKNSWSDYVNTDNMSYDLSLNQKSGAWDLSLKADDDTISAEGTVLDVKRGNGFTLVLDQLKFDSNNMPIFEGQYMVGALGNEPLNVIPQDLGDEIDLFDMEMSEIQNVLGHVAEQLSSMLYYSV